jgi:hypothetical protein
MKKEAELESKKAEEGKIREESDATTSAVAGAAIREDEVPELVHPQETPAASGAAAAALLAQQEDFV